MVITLLSLAVLIVLFVIFSPTIIAGTLAFVVLLSIAIAFFVIAGVISFFWYISRNEPAKGESKNYSISKGKNI